MVYLWASRFVSFPPCLVFVCAFGAFIALEAFGSVPGQSGSGLGVGVIGFGLGVGVLPEAYWFWPWSWIPARGILVLALEWIRARGILVLALVLDPCQQAQQFGLVCGVVSAGRVLLPWCLVLDTLVFGQGFSG